MSLADVRARAARGVRAALEGQRRTDLGKTEVSGTIPTTAPTTAPTTSTIKIFKRLERLLGGDEPARNLSIETRLRLSKLKRDPRTPESLKNAIEEAEAKWTHRNDNGKLVATCAVEQQSSRSAEQQIKAANQQSGKAANRKREAETLVATGCVFDRAHLVRKKGTNDLRPAAYGGRRMRSAWRSDFHAEPRLYLRSEMRWVDLVIEGQRRRVLVGPDTHAESIVERAAEIARQTGVNLLGGNTEDLINYEKGGNYGAMAQMQHALLARGGAEYAERASSAVRLAPEGWEP